jgi:hypothetical protein
MPPDEYQVHSSGRVTEQFREVMNAARDRGILTLALRASKWIMEELARTPMLFGESRDYFAHLDLHLRIGFAGPFSVQFAVHEESRQVFIRSFKLGG